MGHWRKNYGYNGGYDSTGRWRSEAWHMDGGANDEGFYQAYCPSCGRKTEHERAGDCVACYNRVLSNRMKQTIREVIVSGSSGDHTVKVYPNGKKYCSCQGFKFRKDCKHVRSVV